jgi:hypothetical protein
MDKEEKEKLQKEYDEFSKKNYYGSTLMYPLYFAFGFSLIIFWLPVDILSQYPSLKYFTQFMADVFPNINVFANRSKIPELTEFYFSYMWLIAILMAVYAITLIPKANEEAKKYFGTGKYKGKSKLPSKYLIFYSYEKILIGFILMTTLMGFAFYKFYTGHLIDDSFLKINFEESISKRFGMFFMINLFQNGALGMIISIMISSIIFIKQIKQIKKGE